MKKILTGLIIVLCLVLSMSACANEDSDGAEDTVDSGSEELNTESEQSSDNESDTKDDDGKESEADTESGSEPEGETKQWSPYI